MLELGQILAVLIQCGLLLQPLISPDRLVNTVIRDTAACLMSE